MGQKGIDVMEHLKESIRGHEFESRLLHQFIGSVAQSGEHMVCNLEVVGSIPTTSTNSRDRISVGKNSPLIRARS